MLIVTIINTYIPYISGKVLNSFLENTLSLKMIVIITLSYLIKLLFQYYLSRNTNYLAGLITLDLKKRIINQYLNSSSYTTDFIQSGDIHQRIFNELGLLQGKLIFGTIYFFRDLVFFVFLLVSVSILSPILFSSLILFSLTLYLYHTKVSRSIGEINLHRQVENSKFSSLFLEIIFGKNDIIIFNLSKKTKKVIDKQVGKIIFYVSKNSFFQGLSDVFIELIIVLFIASTVFILLYEKMNTTTIVTTLAYLILLLWPVNFRRVYFRANKI
jgi:ABC-type transport system involved in cytochrome bd biosynthesis fused ATPase/permease subunit